MEERMKNPAGWPQELRALADTLHEKISPSYPGEAYPIDFLRTVADWFENTNGAKWDAKSTLIFEDITKLRVASQVLMDVNDLRIGPIVGYGEAVSLRCKIDDLENKLCTWLTARGLESK
jgi:hypothetical protein